MTVKNCSQKRLGDRIAHLRSSSIDLQKNSFFLHRSPFGFPFPVNSAAAPTYLETAKRKLKMLPTYIFKLLRTYTFHQPRSIPLINVLKSFIRKNFFMLSATMPPGVMMMMMMSYTVSVFGRMFHPGEVCIVPFSSRGRLRAGPFLARDVYR